MTIVRESYDFKTNAAGETTLTVNKPTGTVSGDVLVCTIGFSGGPGTVTLPDGWNQVAFESGATNPQIGLYYKVAGGSEPTSYSWTITNAINSGMVIARYSGVNNTTVGDVTAVSTASATAVATLDLTGVTIQTDQAMLITCFSVNSGSTTITEDSTLVSEVYETTAGRRTELDDGLVSTGATGVINYDLGASRACAGIVWALRPASSAPTVYMDTALLTVTKPAITVSAGLANGLYVKNWRFYTDATPDGSMTALANENVVPTLTQAQNENGTIRLRFQLQAVGQNFTSSTISMDYSQDGTNWLAIGAQSPSNENLWVWAKNGAATSGNTIGTQLLTGTTVSGIYLENTNQSSAVNTSEIKEFDFAIQPHWLPPTITVRLRITFGGSVLNLYTGAEQIRFTTPSVANRTYAVDYMPPTASGGQNRALKMAFHRHVHYGTANSRYWFFKANNVTATQFDYYYWTGTGAWSSQLTKTFSAGTEIDRIRSMMKTISSNDVVMVLQNSSGLNIFRGVAGTSSITWGSEIEITASTPGDTCAISIDDGNYWWVGGINGTSGVFAYRSTNADAGSSWTNGWTTQLTAADSGVASGNGFAIIGLASNKALAVWYNGTALKWATVTNAGFGTVNTLAATANSEDWGLVRSNGYVYLVYTDNTGVGGNWILTVFNESNDTWTTGTSPGISGQPTNHDGIPLTANGNDIYAFGTWGGVGGGQDRIIKYAKYTGPGTSGTWGSNADYGPNDRRGNGDEITSIANASLGGKLLVMFSFNDCDLTGTGFTVEAHPLAISTNVSITMDTAVITVGKPAISVSASAVVNISLDTALITAGKPVLSVSEGAVTKVLDTALITTTKPAISVSQGAITKVMDTAVITTIESDLIVSITGAQTIVMDTALITTIESDVSITSLGSAWFLAAGTRDDMTRIIGMYDTQANIEANNANIQEMLIATATDGNKFGIFVNGSWHWFTSA